MKSHQSDVKKLSSDNRGVFGLTSVQAFFGIILGIALLAYVIVVIMGTLQNSTVIPSGSLSATVPSETGGFTNQSGYVLSKANTVPGFSNAVIIAVYNSSAANGGLVVPGNYSLVSGNRLVNTTTYLYPSVNVTYSYSYNSDAKNQADGILTNTSAGITGFFSSINPVYAILAILVIILVLVVLVRVVSGGVAGDGRVRANPQL